MTSKTFKSAMTDNRELEVDVIFRKPRVLIKEFDGDNTGFVFAPADAPALALAILEAAGAHKDSQDFLGGAVEQLKFHIGEQERAIAEARERAELEAEALELFNVNQVINLPDWGNADRAVISSWVRVASLAREMRAEK